LLAGVRWSGKPERVWVQDSYGTLVHRPSGRRARLEGFPGDHGPVRVVSMRVSDQEQRLLIAAGDWKVGPYDAFWCHATIRGEFASTRPRGAD
jgi:hypothetical protein